MNIIRRRTDLPPEVLSAIGDFMHHRRRDSSPIIMADAVDAIMRVFPRLRLATKELSDAIAEAAIAGRLSIYFDKPQLNNAGFEGTRWADDGGR